MAGPRGTSESASARSRGAESTLVGAGSLAREGAGSLAREVELGRGPLTGMGSEPAIRGLIETNPGERWSWRDRAWVLNAVKRSGATHYVYASETDDLLTNAWRRPFPKRFLKPFADMVDERVAVFGICLTPSIVDLSQDAEAVHQALARKVDQVLDIGFELVMLRFDRQFNPIDLRTQVELANTLWEHVEGRTDLVVVPRDLHEMWSTPSLQTLSSSLAADVHLAWGGPEPLPDEITASMVQARAEATGGRAPFVWDDIGMNYLTREDRLDLGPYLGRDPKALSSSIGWLRNTPIVARTTVPQLITYSAWLSGDDPESALESNGGDLRSFIEGCDGRIPFQNAVEVSDQLGTADWIEPLSSAVSWLEAALVAETPHMGSGVRRWRKHLHEEAECSLLFARAIQLLQPIAQVNADGSGVALAPDTESVLNVIPVLGVFWKEMCRKTTSVMGERFSLDVRLAPTPSGTRRPAAPILVADRNATDHLAQTLFQLLEATPPVRPDLTVECDGEILELGSDGHFTAPPGRAVLVSWGERRTTVLPGQELPFPDDQRLAARSWVPG